MALILAVDTDGTQAPALGRLARELPGHELLSADSCSAAVSFVRQRVPDLVLVPLLLPASEEAELQAQLRAVSGRVHTLTIPLLALDGSAAASPSTGASTEPCDPKVFAAQIRQYLSSPISERARAAPPPDPNAARRAQVAAAAMAAINWVRGRRAEWTDAVQTPAPEVFAPGPAAAMAAERVLPAPRAAAGAFAADDWQPSALPAGTADDFVPEHAAGPSLGSRAADAARTAQGSAARWLPRLVLVALAIGLVAAGRAYWPSVRGMLTNGTLVLESVPPGSEVFIDGSSRGTTPLTTELRSGPHTVEFRNGDQSETVEVVVAARDRVVERFDWTAKPSGDLAVTSDPPGARVLVDGEERGRTPVTLQGLTAGSHALVLEGDSGTVRRNVTIVADQTVEVNELIFSGWATVFSPFDVQISEGGRTLAQDDRNQVMLSPGTHSLRIQNAALGYDEVRTVDIRPATATPLSIVPAPTSITVTASEAADVFIDGVRVGSTPLSAPVALGTREVVVRTASGSERRTFITATVAPVQHHVQF